MRKIAGSSSLVFFVLFLSFLQPLRAASPTLDPDERRLLQQIATKIKKDDWDFNVDPCSGTGAWNYLHPDNLFESSVGCDCSFSNSSLCHIVSIKLKGQNISGEIPPDFSQFPYLKQLDLARNVLIGSIPEEWANMQLTDLSLMGNQLTGPFPNVLMKITSLTNLTLEGNNFNGPIPPELGSLLHLEKLVLASNNFTGELPVELSKLSNLIELLLSSNNFSGKIPSFITNFTNLTKLRIQGCNFEGPIPSTISQFTNLIDLRISDLSGNESTAFPDLSRMESLKNLILRNCSIQGNIPPYIGYMQNLQNLDLSFNRLVGEIPSSFSKLKKPEFIFLTGNQLTGHIPVWILRTNQNVDISYNNFTLGDSSPTQCLQGNVNTVESYSPEVNNIESVHPCMKQNFPCSSTNKQYNFALHINCGGQESVIDGTKYEADTLERGASSFYLGSNWALSSTGNFMDNAIGADTYVSANTSTLSLADSELYIKARMSPLSLTYYGLCMMKGIYTVNLHFAEIVFTSDNTFNSIGKRIFNVFIQGKMVLENFNIEDAAGGTGKSVIKSFVTTITDNTLKIQLYWAGKGTTGIPRRGNYGPLISAISVTPNFDPPRGPGSSGDKKKHIIIGIVVSIFVLLLALLSLGIWRRRHRHDSIYNGIRLQKFN